MGIGGRGSYKLWPSKKNKFERGKIIGEVKFDSLSVQTQLQIIKMWYWQYNIHYQLEEG